MGTIISVLNKSGAIFCQHGLTMLVQFGVLTSLLFLADIAIRRRVKASLRYCLWCLVLVKLVLPTTLSLPTGIGHLAGVNFSVQLTQVKLPSPQIQTAYVPTKSTPAQTSSEFTRPTNLPQDIVAKAAESLVSAEAIPLNWQGGIFIAWLFGVVLLLAGFIRRIASIKKLITQSEPAPEQLADMVHTCQKRIGVKGIVELRLSNNMVSPAVCGLLRHIIIVPTGLLEKMDRSKLEMVLMHELSHVKRADLWVNLFQTILQIFYFYNPFVWAANAYIRRVREQAVDEMVLTRLNCAAASYSNTLIDVAEKAFSRPRFGLATVSIIESKSKLKERIKIMLNKPIPKDTKIGFAGLVLIIAFAAILLPMAKATKPERQTTEASKTTTTPFTAKLDNGVTVELVGICEYPTEGKKWWRTDGSEVAETFNVKETGTISAKGKQYAILYKIAGPNGMAYSLDIEGSQGQDSLLVTDSQGHNIYDISGMKFYEDEQRTEADIKVNVTAGPWTTTRYNGVGIKSVFNGEYGTVFSTPQQTDKGVMLVVSDNSIGCDSQVVAIDDNNDIHTCPKNQGGINMLGTKSTPMHQTTAVFSDIALNKIKEFQFQTRPYQLIEFRNVSLRPGVKTDVQQVLQTPQPIGFKITSMEFQNGDSITITDLSGPAGMIRPGETYTVRGRYTLKSHDDAALYVYATNGETSSSQGPIIKRGEGQFTRTFTVLKEGDLHLSFYPAKGGESFGGVYFAQRGAEARTEAVQKTGAEVVDLAVESFDIRPYPEGGLYSVFASIRNKGESTSPKFRVCFYKNDTERKKPMNNSVGPIKTGEVWNESSMPFALNEGANEFAVVLDPDNTIRESDRTNNEASMKVIVKDGKIVDKKVSLSSAKGTGKETTGISDQAINAAEFGGKSESDTNNTQAAKTGEQTMDVQSRGEEIIKRMAEVNRYWLIGPPAEVKNYSYDFALYKGETKTFKVPEPSSADRAIRQGITYDSLLHKLAKEPFAATYTSIEEVNGIIRTDFKLKESMQIHAGNGLRGRWYGSFNQPVEGGTFWIDAKKMFPVRAKCNEVYEYFSDYAAIDDTHYVPLRVKIDKNDMPMHLHFDWKFKLHKPGLWLFDESYYFFDENKPVVAASIDNVRVNEDSSAGSDSVQGEVATHADSSPPVVVRTTPVTFANDVSADLNNLTVTFNQQMTDKSWSWVQWDAPYPETTGQPYYDNERKTCSLPVKLKAGQAYLVAFNVEPYLGFVNLSGSPAKPYVLVFATKDKDGKPTVIPEELIAKARSVNESTQKTSSGLERKESRTESAPYTQIIYDDIRPDGTISFKNTIRETNKSGREITTQNFINSDFVQVTAMRDANGSDLKFTSVHDGDIYRYEVTFNEPISPNGLIEYTTDGTMKGLIKPVAGSEGVFQYYMRHSPAAGEPTRRVETYLLPAGAELISTTPNDMEKRTKNGRVELHVEKMIPIGGSITTSFQYRMP